ncbi:hypothetical protein N7495_005990 [Penicillium taxi]|uniref:uncharacterized protein n=1 Tax=Penicillium taxi TaxID=168475 RepID=UPI00254523AC|nr:uncharacterized protein N7495_005990 [Penicillium taxi]KAJ5894299.1 hypothetical protein N7495_005990 [Penicillium taxi]
MPPATLKMPEVIDLISSDPPISERDQLRQTQLLSRRTPTKPPSNLQEVISSDPIDAPCFTYNDALQFDQPAKKRRVSKDISPLRQSTTVKDVAGPNLRSSFLFSDDDFSLPPFNPAASRKDSKIIGDESDPIMFTSSAPELSTKIKQKSNLSTGAKANTQYSDIITLDDDDEDPWKKAAKNQAPTVLTQESIDEFSDPFSMPGFAEMIGLSQPGKTACKTVFSSKTARLLSTLNTKHNKPKPTGTSELPGARKDQVTNNICTFSDSDDLDLDEPVEPRRHAKKSSKTSTEDKEAKANARAALKMKKDQERQLEKERKQQLKEEKTKQKQLAADISEVNKLKVDKKDSTPEMIIDISASMEGTSVGNQTVEYMKRLGVEHNFVTSPVPNIVKWRRKMNATYNEDAGHWEPCPSHIKEEKNILCLVSAQDFVDMVITSPDGEEEESLDVHVLKVRSLYPDCKPIYLIEGLMSWMRKNRNSRNRAYQAEVLRQYDESLHTPADAPDPPRRRGRKPKNKPETTPPVDDDTIEDALLTLQVAHSCLIHHTNAPPESAEWIKNFTEHISTIPYRRERMEGNDAAFCMDVGQVKSGEDKHDTFVKMLQEVNRVTASMAYGIMNQYPSATDLSLGMHIHGPKMLEDVKKSANKNGGLADSRIGPAASKRLYKVFTGLDPTSADV